MFRTLKEINISITTFLTTLHFSTSSVFSFISPRKQVFYLTIRKQQEFPLIWPYFYCLVFFFPRSPVLLWLRFPKTPVLHPTMQTHTTDSTAGVYEHANTVQLIQRIMSLRPLTPVSASGYGDISRINPGGISKGSESMSTSTH